MLVASKLNQQFQHSINFSTILCLTRVLLLVKHTEHSFTFIKTFNSKALTKLAALSAMLTELFDACRTDADALGVVNPP
jgi:hypothetical protein